MAARGRRLRLLESDRRDIALGIAGCHHRSDRPRAQPMQDRRGASGSFSTARFTTSGNSARSWSHAARIRTRRHGGPPRLYASTVRRCSGSSGMYAFACGRSGAKLGPGSRSIRHQAALCRRRRPDGARGLPGQGPPRGAGFLPMSTQPAWPASASGDTFRAVHALFVDPFLASGRGRHLPRGGELERTGSRRCSTCSSAARRTDGTGSAAGRDPRRASRFVRHTWSPTFRRSVPLRGLDSRVIARLCREAGADVLAVTSASRSTKRARSTRSLREETRFFPRIRTRSFESPVRLRRARRRHSRSHGPALHRRRQYWFVSRARRRSA